LIPALLLLPALFRSRGESPAPPVAHVQSELESRAGDAVAEVQPVEPPVAEKVIDTPVPEPAPIAVQQSPVPDTPRPAKSSPPHRAPHRTRAVAAHPPAESTAVGSEPAPTANTWSPPPPARGLTAKPK
jgi:translation initiation factor IF-2